MQNLLFSSDATDMFSKNSSVQDDEKISSEVIQMVRQVFCQNQIILQDFCSCRFGGIHYSDCSDWACWVAIA
jgi:hypothetical protein